MTQRHRQSAPVVSAPTLPPHAAVTLPDGLVGCPEWRQFRLETYPDIPIGTLECLDSEGVRFLVTEAREVQADYRPSIDQATLEALQAGSPEEVLVLCTVRTHGPPLRITANLLGPILLNPASGLAVQLVLYDSGYTTEHDLAGAPYSSLQAALAEA